MTEKEMQTVWLLAVLEFEVFLSFFTELLLKVRNILITPYIGNEEMTFETKINFSENSAGGVFVLFF